MPVALLVFFASASPAAASDWSVNVIDFEFQPQARAIAVGDSVTWNFAKDGHTATSRRGQPDSWNSAPDGGTNSAGAPFTKVFTTPGRYQYYCIPHSFMEGVIQVGTDTVADSIDNFKSKRTGNRVKLSFLLTEAGHGHLQAHGQVAPYGQAGPSRRRPAQLHAAPPEARHLPRRPHGRGRLRQESHPAELLRDPLTPARRRLGWLG